MGKTLEQFKKQARDIKRQVEDKLKTIQTAKELEEFQRQILGRQGRLREFFNQLKGLPGKERAEAGRLLNQTKQEVEKYFELRSRDLGAIQNTEHKIRQSSFDPTFPARRRPVGRLHPLTRVQKKAVSIFEKMGFSVAEGPYIETEFYNFDALNIPPDHPARDLWDTFWLQSRQKVSRDQLSVNQRSGQNTDRDPRIADRHLLRTHTSPVQVRFMEKNNPPLRAVFPGRCFRYEKPDSTHNFEFYQLEGLMVGAPGKVTAAHLKWVAQQFFERFLEKEVEVRFLPDYFPFTEPSFEIDVRLPEEQPNSSQWLELAGAGMVHPKVFEAAGYNPAHWQGWAFGLGLDRLAMLKYKTEDVRMFYSNDLRILRGFR